jgi:hypothetical protein
MVSDITTSALGANTGPAQNSATFAWSPDESLVGVIADYTVDNDFDVYLFDSTGTNAGVRLTGPAVTNGDTNVIAFSSDGSRLYISGDLVVNNEYEMFSTSDFTTANQMPANILDIDVVTDGDLDSDEDAITIAY